MFSPCTGLQLSLSASVIWNLDVSASFEMSVPDGVVLDTNK